MKYDAAWADLTEFVYLLYRTTDIPFVEAALEDIMYKMDELEEEHK